MINKFKREAAFASISLIVTMALYTYMADGLAHRIYDSYYFPHSRPLIEGIVYALALIVVAYGAMLYHVCLIGHYVRSWRHKPATEAEIAEELYDAPAPSLTVLIPAYKEERNVMWQTLMSAALSLYPGKRVVLLVDDPYNPKTAEDRKAIETARALPHELQAEFDAQATIHRDAQSAYQARKQLGSVNAGDECRHLADGYDAVADWLRAQADTFAEGVAQNELAFDKKFFNQRILLEPAEKYDARAHELRLAASHAPLSEEEITRHYALLTGMFNTRFSSFERKKYVNLSHDANKAMNLNSYMVLIGKSWQEIETDRGLQLRECAPEEATFTIPAADYVDTIDADSLMTHDYVSRLIHFMQQPENARVAVAQSPCSSIPGSPREVERVAGACIDVQFHTHQGYTWWDASFWVGANAMLRMTAMEVIKEVKEMDGKTVAIYIQDRTVIEDTESSIDLVHKGWKLYNYPVRMTFSATPPDFGSLLIQRRRWANGGLIILPKLLRYFWFARKDVRLAKEMFMRMNYLVLTSAGCVVTYLLIFHSFSHRLHTSMLVYANLPLLMLYGRDLKNCGYKYLDALRVAALNLMLFPVITAGVLKQFQQIVTGRKIPFGRTPKVQDRVAAPAIYYLAEIAVVVYYGFQLVAYYKEGQYGSLVCAAINASIFMYAIFRFIGVRAMAEDLSASMVRPFRRRRQAAIAAAKVAA